jgi:tetratricopeptide (TPR) repeat protein
VPLPPSLTTLLLNLSATYLRLGAPLAALEHAAAAIAVDPSAPKAYFRAGMALDALGEVHASTWLVFRCGARLTHHVTYLPNIPSFRFPCYPSSLSTLDRPRQ